MNEISKMTDAELDEAIAREVMGWEEVYEPPKESGDQRHIFEDEHGKNHFVGGEKFREIAFIDYFEPTHNNMTQAWQVVEKVREMYSKVCNQNNDPKSEMKLLGFLGYFVYRQIELWDVTPRAICEAALAAVRSNRE